MLLEAKGLAKTFIGTQVLKGVDISVGAGEIRALVGQNGSGKSTLIKILTGVHAPDPGAELRLRGHEVSLPVAARRSSSLGFGVMHQDTALEGTMSVLDNFLLGGPDTALSRIRWRREARRVTGELKRYGLDVDVQIPAEELTSGQRAVVAMARAFDRIETGGTEEGVLVLDEPTSSLERQGVETLFAGLHAAKQRGCGVLFVSHDLGEVRTLCDSVSVLRDGMLVAEGPMSDFDELELIKAIVGKDIGDLYPPVPAPRETPIVLAARGLRGSILRDVSLELHAGEIVGVTGLAGMGQDELPSLLYGSETPRGGEVLLEGEVHHPDPARSMAEGIIMMPSDRKKLGGDLNSSVSDNLTIPIVARYYRRARINTAAAARDVLAVLQRFDVRPQDPTLLLGELSGGNQQKALLGKWLSLFGDARVALLHEATQGVDVGARQDIFRHIRESADKGLAVLYVSTDYEDVAHLCDRVLVIRNGTITAELDRAHASAGRIAALALASDGGRIR